MTKTISSKPAAYSRRNSSWHKWLGKKGKVIAATYIWAAGEEHRAMVPYSHAVVDFKDQRLELMGASHEKLKAGDEVECVLRKNPTLAHVDKAGLIDYQLKVKKISQS